MELYMSEYDYCNEKEGKQEEVDKSTKYYVIANDDKVVAKVNEDWIAYEIVNKLKDQFDTIEVCEIL